MESAAQATSCTHTQARSTIYISLYVVANRHAVSVTHCIASVRYKHDCMQVAEAQAATGRLIVHLEPSLDQPASPQYSDDAMDHDGKCDQENMARVHDNGTAALQHAALANQQQAVQGKSQSKAAKPKPGGRGAELAAKMKAAPGRKPSNKRANTPESDEDLADAALLGSKRQKVCEAEEEPQGAQSPAADTRASKAIAQEKLGNNPDRFVGRQVQQEFEDGIFKVGNPQDVLYTPPHPPCDPTPTPPQLCCAHCCALIQPWHSDTCLCVDMF